MNVVAAALDEVSGATAQAKGCRQEPAQALLALSGFGIPLQNGPADAWHRTLMRSIYMDFSPYIWHR